MAQREVTKASARKTGSSQAAASTPVATTARGRKTASEKPPASKKAAVTKAPVTKAPVKKAAVKKAPVKTPTSRIAGRRAVARDGANPAYRERRQEILRAAAQVFKTKGLAGANLGDIAAQAGADRASLYYYVGSKEELFQEVVREAVEANLRWARDFRTSDVPAPQKLRQMLSSLMASYGENYPILYVFVQENLSHMPQQHAAWSKEMRASNREFEKIFIDVIEDGVKQGTIRDVGSSTLAAYGVLGMLGWTYRWFNPETSEWPAEEIAATFSNLLLLGLQTGRKPPRKSS